MLNDNQGVPPGSTENVSPVDRALGLLDQDKLASLLSSNFLSEQEPKSEAPTEPIAAEEEQDASTEEGDQVLSQPEPEQEEEEETEEQPAEEEEEEQSNLPRGVQKRIAKLAAAKRAAKEAAEAAQAKVAELEAKLDAAKQEAPAATKSRPVASEYTAQLKSIDAVEDALRSAVDVILWTEENPEGGVIPLADGSERELTAEEVRQMRKTAIRRKEVELPARRKFLEQEAQYDAPTVQEYPWWKKPEAPEYQVAQKILRDMPELKGRPDWKHVVSVFIEGIAARQHRLTKAKATAPAAPKKAPAQPGATVAAKSTGADKALEAKRRFAREMRSDSLAEVIKAAGLI